MNEKVHGANARFTFSNGRLYVGSRTTFRKPDGPGLWCDVARKYDRDHPPSYVPDLALYGEVYGYARTCAMAWARIRIWSSSMPWTRARAVTTRGIRSWPSSST